MDVVPEDSLITGGYGGSKTDGRAALIATTLTALDEAAADRRVAKTAEAAAMGKIRELADVADKLGVARVTIIRRSGVAVATAYAMFTLPNRRGKKNRNSS